MTSPKNLRTMGIRYNKIDIGHLPSERALKAGVSLRNHVCVTEGTCDIPETMNPGHHEKVSPKYK